MKYELIPNSSEAVNRPGPANDIIIGLASIGKNTQLITGEAAAPQWRDTRSLIADDRIEKTLGRAFWRYETDSGALAFECPTGEKCNLEVPARNREQPRELRVTSISSVEKASADVRAVSPVEVRADSNDVERVLKEARAVPHFENGEVKDWSKVEGQPGGVYDNLSLRNGDIITETQAAPLDSEPAPITAGDSSK